MLLDILYNSEYLIKQMWWKLAKKLSALALHQALK